MKLSKGAKGCFFVGMANLLFFGGHFWYGIWPFLKAERQASFAVQQLGLWTKEDCENVWEEATRLASQHPDGKEIQENEPPEPLRRAGFRVAYVDESEFRARHGGSSFGSNGGGVYCLFMDIRESEPHMVYSGGIYYPDGRWEPFH